MPEGNEQKKVAQIVCAVINKKKCKNCNFRCIAYEIADALAKTGCYFVPDYTESETNFEKENQIKELSFNLIMATSPLGVKDLTKTFDYKTVATDLYEKYGWRKHAQ